MLRLAGSPRVGALTLLVVGVLLAWLPWALSGPDRPVTIIYGDSLTVLSEPAAKAMYRGHNRLFFRARGGTAMCDWVGQARFDALTLHPARVVLAFTGNTASCARRAFATGGAAGATALYEHSLRQMRATFPDVPAVVVIPPAMHNLQTGWYPFNGDPMLVAMYERVGTQLHMIVDHIADDTLTPGHVFTAFRPKFPNGPIVQVRTSDGVHVTPEGAQWFAAALLEVPVSSSQRAPAASAGGAPAR